MFMNGTNLQLSVPEGVAHDAWGVNNSVRVMQPTQNENFEIVTKFESIVNKRYQTQGILVEQDANNYLRFDTHYDQGVMLYVASVVNGVPTGIITSGPLVATHSYLRVTRIGDQWTYSTSADGNIWTSAGNNFNRAMNVTSTGVFVANQAFGANPAPAHTAVIDYFFNADAPIIPEDGNPIGNFTIQVDTVGEGTVAVQPVKQTYQCDDVVTLTASPATGWEFSNWSGDLSGSSPQRQIVVEKNYNVVANFTEKQGPPPLLVIYFPMNRYSC